jgi:hypothetical protein
MTRTELLEELRFVVDDSIGPRCAWSDTRLMMWLSEGQDKFCEQSGFWVDKTTYSILTVLGQQDYDIDSRIIAIRSIWDGTRQLIDGAGKTFSDADFADNAAQSPIHYRTDLQTEYVTFLEPVAAGITLSLRVHRRSTVALNHKDANGEYDTELQIPEEFHLAVVEYAASKAFGDHDRELQDPVKADDHLQNFEDYVRAGKTAYRRLTGGYVDVVPNPLYVV